MRYFYVYDEENLIDTKYLIIGSIREYTNQHRYDMDISDWSWYLADKKAPNYKHKGYGKALFSYIMNEILPQKEDSELCTITIGHSYEDAVSFYEHNFAKSKNYSYRA